MRYIFNMPICDKHNTLKAPDMECVWCLRRLQYALRHLAYDGPPQGKDHPFAAGRVVYATIAGYRYYKSDGGYLVHEKTGGVFRCPGT